MATGLLSRFRSFKCLCWIFHTCIAVLLFMLSVGCGSNTKHEKRRIIAFGKLSKAEFSLVENWITKSSTNDIAIFCSAFPECEILVMRVYNGNSRYRIVARRFLFRRYVFNAWVFVSITSGSAVIQDAPGEFHFFGLIGDTDLNQSVDVDNKNQLYMNRKQFEDFVKNGANFREAGLQLITNKPIKDFRRYLE